MCKSSLEYAEVHGLELYKSKLKRDREKKAYVDLDEDSLDAFIKLVEKRIKELRER